MIQNNKVDHIHSPLLTTVKTGQRLSQSFSEKRITLLTEYKVIENIPSHDKDSLYVKEGLPKPLTSLPANYPETPRYTSKPLL